MNSIKKQRKFNHTVLYMKRSISTKMFIIILTIVLPLNILAIILSSVAVKNVEQQAKQTVLNIMINYMEDVKERMDEIGYLLYTMQKNDTNATIMAKQKGDYEYTIAKYKFFKSFNDIFMVGNVTDGAFYYMGILDDILVWDKNTSRHTKADMQDYIKSEMIKNARTGWCMTMIPGSGKKTDYPVLWQVIKITDLYYGGFIELDEAKATLKNDLQYSILEVAFTKTERSNSDKDAILVSAYWKEAGLYFNVAIDRNDVNGSVYRMYSVMRFVAFFALLLIPIFYFLIARLLINPLKIVNMAHVELENGNPDYRITKKANSIEYQSSFDSFNVMAESIKKLKMENYEKELSKQKTEIRNLQLQIRPHFLLNIFNLIYMLSQKNDMVHIQEIILYLSDYFRYIFRSNKDLELYGKEQKVIEGYINMAQVRYPGGIEISYDYDPEIMFVRIPPLLVHNFVENIIKHVVKQGKVIHISLMGQYHNGTVTFTVVDDGEGMSEEQVRAVDLRMRSEKIDGTNVGMANAYRRLKLFYGNSANIEISSDIGVGTSITISFPYDLEECDESVDS